MREVFMARKEGIRIAFRRRFSGFGKRSDENEMEEEKRRWRSQSRKSASSTGVDEEKNLDLNAE
jgi:hypothetical protein